ncbi:SCF ubiquitin ligase complex subunit cdc4 [Arachnomyces sp. PD_36]|nr:SCF ubiquitin ligase complex subunit cdc4 [Arachnomyces sp. PD_36]
MSLPAQAPADSAELSSISGSKDASPTSTTGSPEPPSSYPPFSDLAPSRHLEGEHYPRDASHDVPSTSAIGRLSFAPATQTTVVTTTTTTTTDFPPFVMRAPRCTQELDPKLYPLASTPTPASIRNIKFEIGGKSVIFNEPDDTTSALGELNDQQEALKASNGEVRSVATFSPSGQTTLPRRSASGKPWNGGSIKGKETRKRPLSPESISRAAHAANRARLSSGLPNDLTRQGSAPWIGSASRTRSPQPRTIGLATPETDHHSFSEAGPKNPQKRLQFAGPSKKHRFGQPDEVEQQETPQTRQLKKQSNRKGLNFAGLQETPLLQRRGTSGAGKLESQLQSENGLSTEDVTESARPTDQGETGSLFSTTERKRPLSIPSRLSATDSAADEDLCLPSPSLSPVTAMNNHQNADYFDSADEQDTDAESTGGTRDESSLVKHNDADPTGVGHRQSSTPSLMDIPSMLNFFESVPDEMKTYVMYQMLRRCPKPTLHFVADVVNPALKCDFLTMLPLELSWNVVKYLDVQTMCRASQVSKRWRHIINTDEKTWKHLFEKDGYVLSAEELHRAVVEGWGWQFPNGDMDYEKDISSSTALKSDSECSSVSASSTALAASQDQPLGSLAPVLRRPKRKAITRASSRKLAKRNPTANSSEKPESTECMARLTTDEGPYAAASAAALAVPYPDVGLPSLRSLHLFKSLYQRHYSIRNNWMRDGMKPMHIAFRAHDRHVVTCLQFDSDKILTGSDDTNINVYDTKTGALRATLEGHEGGVWALEYYGNTLVSGSTDRSVRVWDIDAAKCTQVFQGHTSTVRCLQILLPVEVGKLDDGSPKIMPKQPLIITGSRDSNLRVWKLPQTGDPRFYQAGPAQDDTDCPYFVRVLTGHQHSVRAIAAHGDTLVSGSYDCTVRVWKISTGETVHRLQGHTLKVYSVVLDHERNRCISGSMDHMVKVWSLDTGAVLYNLEGHSSLVGLLDLKADRLVSAAADSTLRIWDPENGQCKSTLTAHTGAITCFQHDGRKVISGSDRTLKMWNVRTGECVKDLLTDLSGVWQVRFNERRCVAAVQRDSLTYIEVLDFGAYRDGVPHNRLGKRTVVDRTGQEIDEEAVNGEADTAP